MRISDWSSDVCSSDLAEFKDGPLAHLPSGSYAANAAWVACAAMAFNIARAVDALGAPGRARARWASVRTRLINVPARIAATGRRLVLHLPRDWPWAPDWQNTFTAATGPPDTPPICTQPPAGTIRAHKEDDQRRPEAP